MMKGVMKKYDELDNNLSFPSIIQKVGQSWSPSHDTSSIPKQDSPSQPTPS